MRRKVLVIGVVVLASLAVSWLLVAQRQPEWTTGSAAALRELEHGLDAQGKVYSAEALEHFRKAVALDPDFTMARLFELLTSSESKDLSHDRSEAVSRLEKTDPSGLKPRERFLLGYYLKIFRHDAEGADRILEAYLADEPDDPFALDILGRRQVSRRDWTAAEKTFKRLVDVAPNRVEAYNQLGYIALARGDFADGERMFRTYMYLAPDQANPHDSLAELLILAGRYDEAREQLEQALVDKPDFCVAFQHMQSVAILKGSMDGMEAVVERARAAGCEEPMLARMRCQTPLWRAMHAQDWEAVWQALSGECGKILGEDTLRFTSAVRTGRTADADAALTKYSHALEKEPPSFKKSIISAVSLFMQGQAELAAGRFAAAAERFAGADTQLTYRGVDDAGIFKLYNRQCWYRALVRSGATAQAASLLSEIRAVNPPFADLTERGTC